MTKTAPKMYTHQIKALNFVSDKDVFALYMEMGTGKSKVVIEKVASLRKENKIDCVIVISPNAVKEQWVEEQFEIHYPCNDWGGYIWTGSKTKKSSVEFDNKVQSKGLFVFSCNVEALQSDRIDALLIYLIRNKRCFVVIDESTTIKNGRRKPKRGKRAGAKRANKVLDLFKDVQHKCILTGTPTPNSPFDLWSQFEFLEPNYFGLDFFYFQHRYGILVKREFQKGKPAYVVLDEKTYSIVKNKLSKYEELDTETVERICIETGVDFKNVLTISKLDSYQPYKNLKELKDKMSKVTYFLKKKDCLDLPDKVYETLNCEMGKEQKRVFKEMAKQMYSYYAGKELTVTNKVVVALRLQMIAGGLFPFVETDIVLKDEEEFFETVFKYKRISDNGKIKALKTDLEGVSKDTSIIIWARFRGEIELIHEEMIALGYSCDKYYGGSEYSVIEKFKAGETKVLVVNPLKGAEGLNLQVATLHYFYSNSFRADKRLQAEDRSHRIGQTNKVTYKDLICKDTLDQKIYAILKRKGDLIDYFRTASLKDVIY